MLSRGRRASPFPFSRRPRSPGTDRQRHVGGGKFKARKNPYGDKQELLDGRLGARVLPGEKRRRLDDEEERLRFWRARKGAFGAMFEEADALARRGGLPKDALKAPAQPWVPSNQPLRPLHEDARRTPLRLEERADLVVADRQTRCQRQPRVALPEWILEPPEPVLACLRSVLAPPEAVRI